MQGVDSFFPWKVGASWYAFHGSCNTEKLPVSKWRVGIATSLSLNGPWKRIYEKSPVALEPKFIENPIVTEIKGRGWICVYDNAGNNEIGWGFSQNGTDWTRGKPNVVAPDSASWSWNKDIRTPLGIVYEGDNRYSIFILPFKQNPTGIKFYRNLIQSLPAPLVCRSRVAIIKRNDHEKSASC